MNGFVIFLSTLPARGATGRRQRRRHIKIISIHAPREGSDWGTSLSPSRSSLFLSTLPARGATFDKIGICRICRFLSTLPARGATSLRCRPGWPARISIHAPREGSDRQNAYQDTVSDLFLSTLPARGATCGTLYSVFSAQFLSTLPARGATPVLPEQARRNKISIHAPREGSDAEEQARQEAARKFLSTLPARGAT